MDPTSSKKVSQYIMTILCTLIQITTPCKTTKPKRNLPDNVPSELDPFDWQKAVQVDVTQASPGSSPISLQCLTQQYIGKWG